MDDSTVYEVVQLEDALRRLARYSLQKYEDGLVALNRHDKAIRVRRAAELVEGTGKIDEFMKFNYQKVSQDLQSDSLSRKDKAALEAVRNFIEAFSVETGLRVRD